jgi:DNA-binding MarR family transcriptional regulator
MLEIFITSKTRRKIITVYTKYPDYRVHVRGLAKMIKEDPGNVQRELKKLEKIGFVKSAKEGNARVFFANQHFALYRELQSIVLKSQTKRRQI